MSISVMNMVWGLKADAMTTVQRFVLLALADVADDAGSCFPSTAYLDHKTGMSNRTVRHHLAQLEADGWFNRARHTARGTYTYVIDLDKLEAEQGKTWREKRQEVAAQTGKKLPLQCGKKLPVQRQEVAGPNPSRSVSREPSTTTSSSLRTIRSNSFAGTCSECGKTVKAGAGRLIGKSPAHLEGQCPSKRRIGDADLSARSEEDYGL